MKIAVFGSFKAERPDFPVRGTAEQFNDACSSLGRAIATARETVIVGGSSERTADFHVTQGVFQAAKCCTLSSPLVEVVRPSDGVQPYEELVQAAPDLFAYHSRTEGWWAGAHLVSIREADAVLTIGGGKSSYLAGLAAIAAKKPLVPIGCFGGASERLLSMLAASMRSKERTQLEQLNAPWSQRSSEICCGLLRVGEGPRILLIHGRSTDWMLIKDWLRDQPQLVQQVAVMQQTFGNGLSLPEKFEGIGGSVDGAIAVVTPDDVGGLEGDVLRERARENVWLEVGWFWGRCGRGRVLLLKKGDPTIPSDLSGVEYYSYKDSPRERTEEIRTFLAAIAHDG